MDLQAGRVRITSVTGTAAVSAPTIMRLPHPSAYCAISRNKLSPVTVDSNITSAPAFADATRSSCG
jgi:hypothetical protein